VRRRQDGVVAGGPLAIALFAEVCDAGEVQCELARHIVVLAASALEPLDDDAGPERALLARGLVADQQLSHTDQREGGGQGRREEQQALVRVHVGLREAREGHRLGAGEEGGADREHLPRLRVESLGDVELLIEAGDQHRDRIVEIVSAGRACDRDLTNHGHLLQDIVYAFTVTNPSEAANNPLMAENTLVTVIAPAVLERAVQLDGAEDPSSLALLIACVEAGGDAGLQALLESMLLDGRELRASFRALAALEDVPASRAARRAWLRSDGKIGLADLIAAVALEGSPRVAEALQLRGLTAPELAGQVAEWRLRRDENPDVPARVLAASLLSFSLTLATSLVLALHAFHTRQWWQFVLLVPVWWGYPQEGPVLGFLYALLLGSVVAPAVGALHAASVLAEVIQADSERLASWSHTGVHLTLREQRYVAQRLLNERARRLRRVRQALRAQLRGLRSDSKPA
jgi:hypothetical protein